MGVVRMILWTTKSGIGRSKLTKVEERIFGGDCSCRGSCLHKWSCENEGAPTILWKI